MIKLGDLVNRKYVQKRCEAFEYEIHIENKPDWKYLFSRLPEHDNNAITWNLKVIIPRDQERDNLIYEISYVIPRENMPLTTIAGIGLRLFQMKIQLEQEERIAVDFEISEALKGMI